MLEKLEKSERSISILFMIIINCVLVGSLLYLAFWAIPEYKKQQICHEYFLELREEAGILDLGGIEFLDIFDTLNETEEILKWGALFAKISHDEYDERLGFDRSKMCLCVCNETK